MEIPALSSLINQASLPEDKRHGVARAGLSIRMKHALEERNVAVDVAFTTCHKIPTRKAALTPPEAHLVDILKCKLILVISMPAMSGSRINILQIVQ